MTARKKDEPRMSAEDRLSIYGILKKNFSFDEDYPLANARGNGRFRKHFYEGNRGSVAVDVYPS